jgi:hypothetical protein
MVEQSRRPRVLRRAETWWASYKRKFRCRACAHSFSTRGALGIGIWALPTKVRVGASEPPEQHSFCGGWRAVQATHSPYNLNRDLTVAELPRSMFPVNGSVLTASPVSHAVSFVTS